MLANKSLHSLCLNVRFSKKPIIFPPFLYWKINVVSAKKARFIEVRGNNVSGDCEKLTGILPYSSHRIFYKMPVCNYTKKKKRILTIISNKEGEKKNETGFWPGGRTSRIIFFTVLLMKYCIEGVPENLDGTEVGRRKWSSPK